MVTVRQFNGGADGFVQLKQSSIAEHMVTGTAFKKCQIGGWCRSVNGGEATETSSHNSQFRVILSNVDGLRMVGFLILGLISELSTFFLAVLSEWIVYPIRTGWICCINSVLRFHHSSWCPRVSQLVLKRIFNHLNG